MRKINWGVLGTAGIAYGQTIPGMQKADNCNLYAIAGRNIDKANKPYLFMHVCCAPCASHILIKLSEYFNIKII